MKARVVFAAAITTQQQNNVMMSIVIANVKTHLGRQAKPSRKKHIKY